jgi:excisionase family DNA binding protein
MYRLVSYLDYIRAYMYHVRKGGKTMPASEYMTIGDAAEYLDMDRRQVRRLIERGQLTAEPNPIDGRSKIVKREDVERLNAYPRPSKKAAA